VIPAPIQYRVEGSNHQVLQMGDTVCRGE